MAVREPEAARGEQEATEREANAERGRSDF
jgi:hypothetical protein